MSMKNSEEPFPGLTGGLILLLLGILFLMVTLDFLSWRDWWAWFLAGLGLILIVDAAIRSRHPRYRRNVTGKIIAGLVLIIIGASRFFGMVSWWPLILIVLGLYLIFSSFTKPKT